MITVVDGFLTLEEVEEFKRLIDDRGVQSNRIYLKRELAATFWERHREALTAIGVGKIYNQVTLSNSSTHLKWHKDPIFSDETHKILIYLNELPSGGGTLFKMSDGSIRREQAVPGRLILFDICLEHSGEKFPSGCAKYTIGFRASRGG
ncbi:hypothetical protein EBX31_03625 [bacterium]|nr:hypothetical protein [bacterium]